MRIVSRPRCGGKTTDLIRMAEGGGVCIVAPNIEQVRHIVKMARSMGVKIFPPITWEDFLAGRTRGFTVDFLIDNLDLCLQRYAGAQAVVGASMTGTEIDVLEVPAG